MYDTLKLVDGDIVFDDLGRLVFAEGKEAIAQGIFKRLSTRKEDLFYELEYGIPDYRRMKQMDKYIAEVQAIIEDALSDDPNIDTAQVVNLVPNSRDSYNIQLAVFLTDNTVMNLEFTL